MIQWSGTIAWRQFTLSIIRYPEKLNLICKQITQMSKKYNGSIQYSCRKALGEDEPLCCSVEVVTIISSM